MSNLKNGKIVIILVGIVVLVLGGFLFLGGSSDNNDSEVAEGTRQDVVESQGGEETAGDRCAVRSFSIAVLDGWECRTHQNVDDDVSVFTDNNTLVVSVGKNQNKTSCDAIPGCVEDTTYVLDGYEDVIKFSQPTTGTVEILGVNSTFPSFGILVTSNDALTQAEEAQIQEIADSFAVVQ